MEKEDYGEGCICMVIYTERAGKKERERERAEHQS